jgi:hypothetical protein
MPRKLTETVQVNLRIRENLRRRLDDAAQKANNSLNAEMIERLTRSFENEDLRPQVKSLNETLDGLAERRSREGRVIAGWIQNELRQRGVDEKTTKELAEVIRAYLGGRDI